LARRGPRPPDAAALLEKARRVRELVGRLYSWYVPPFTVSTVALTEDELQSVIRDVCSKSPFAGWMRLDRTYYAVDLETFKKVVDWDWTDARKYVLDRFDCDKFALYFKSRVAIDFGINAIGVVLDYSAGHAYNLVITKDAAGKVEWRLFEPQTDKLFKFEERDKNLYRMEPRSWYLIL
jgi:hypothetical protein